MEVKVDEIMELEDKIVALIKPEHIFLRDKIRMVFQGFHLSKLRTQSKPKTK